MNILARTGLLIVILGIFGFVATEVFRTHPELHVYRKAIAASIAGAGTLLWLVGKVHANTEDTMAKRDKIFTVRFLGIALAGLGAVVTYIAPISELVSSPTIFIRAHASEHLTQLPQLFKAQNEAILGKVDKSKTALQVQGIFYKPTDASAIINGQTVFVGDRVGAARVVAIERQSVVVEIAQEKKVLAFRM